MHFLKTICHPPTGTMVAEEAFWGKKFRFRQRRVFWNFQDPPRWFHEAVPNQQVILIVRKAASEVDLTDNADPKAAQKVDKTKTLYH